MTSLASSFGQLFHNANEESKDKERWVKDRSSIDTETGEKNARNTSEKAAADTPMGNTDDETPFDSMMASIENAEPKEPPQDVDIGSPTPPCSPVVAAQRQRPAQKGKQRLRFSMGEAIMSQNDVLLNVCNYLGLKEFFDLYCVSKRFYVLVNSHYTTHIKQLAHNYAPLASTIFPYQLYKRGCIQDPMLRTRGAHPGDTTAGERTAGAVPAVTRTVPGLKWVLMCAYREALVHDMLLSLALEGHRFPAPIPEAILRIWALLDLPTNGARLAAMHDESLWETRDIFLALMFCVKLDMRFADPVVGSGECVLRRLLLGQKSLVVLWEALRGLTARTRAEVLAMAVEWDGVVPPGPDGVREVREGETLLGVPMEKVGSLSKEWWRQDGKYLLRPDELLLKEGVRRGMNIHRCFLDYMLWGYIDWTWLRPIALPDLAALELADKKRMGGDAADVSSAEEGGRKISSGSFRDMARASGVS
ncbi:hypothetical protein B0J12DRAFT_673386 [Macrophomina phaseolina]|uniref:F-box domain-containing protein n=1 Tax=Macrophomina phaseolina TaxID=35725 RepID=A0ABQ8G220_9PEZI|nr:hypothetical protein B0J12DRAFT_673386 [Macrophomina phaseolina]